jgi:uncharacterized protein YecE (DUF72 family)
VLTRRGGRDDQHLWQLPTADASGGLRRTGARSTLRGIRDYRLGTQSWTYFPDWVGVFYPPRTSAAEALSFYSQVYDTVEVNTTFHALPSASTVRAWYERTPAHFTFALKAPREITHELRLERPEVEAPTRELLRLANVLGEKCGPLLVQLPPSFDRSAANRKTLATFLDLLPSADHRVAIELRHPSWSTPEVEHALRERNIAWVLVDGNQPNHRSLRFPANFTYVRWNRSGLPFANWKHVQYDRVADLDFWAETLSTHLPDHVENVYGYMSNEFAGHAPASLRTLLPKLGLAAPDPRAIWQQGVLF